MWTPLVFLYLFRAARGVRPLAGAILSGFFLGFGRLAGHHQMNLFVSMAAAGLWLWLVVRERKLDTHMLRLAAASMIIAVLASAFQTIPMAEYGHRSVRFAGPQNPLAFNEIVPCNVHQEYSLRPLSILGIFIPNVEYRFVLFIGIFAFSLGIIGAILAWHERHVRWLAAIALGGLFFSLGPNSVFHGMLYSLVPMVEKARVPAAGTLLFALGLGPLAAYGLDLLPRPESALWSRRLGWVLAAAAAIIATLSLVLYTAKISPATDDRLMIPVLAAALGAAILAGWRSGGLSPKAGAVCVIALVLFEIGNVTAYFLPNRNVPEQDPYLHRLAEHGDLIAYIRNRGLAGRVEYDDKDIPYNIGDWYGVETFAAYTASVTSNIWQMDLFSPKGRDFFGIRYYLGKTPQRPEQRELFTAAVVSKCSKTLWHARVSGAKAALRDATSPMMMCNCRCTAQISFVLPRISSAPAR